MLLVLFVVLVVFLAFGGNVMALGRLGRRNDHRRAGERRQRQDENEFFHKMWVQTQYFCF